MIKPCPHKKFMELAHIEAQQSTCLKKQVGAIIVNNEGMILGWGCNDAPKGEPTCIDEDSCLIIPEYPGKCKRTIHAEMWALHRARPWLGPDVYSICYTTFAPCWGCYQALRHADVTQVIYDNKGSQITTPTMSEVCSLEEALAMSAKGSAIEQTRDCPPSCPSGDREGGTEND